jgi:diguanylate cyclase (GGDEF)-like protein
MSPFDNAPAGLFGLTERLEPALPAFDGHPPSPLPPFLFDLDSESPHRRLDRALAWAAEAQQIIAAQNERIAYLETLTMTDELTGLLNRRGFFSHFQRELAHAQRHPAAGGVLVMLDIDAFKTVNDTLGHDAGDAVLRRVAKLLGTLVRGQDVVARLGGDEFTILLTSVEAGPGTERAAALAHRLNSETLTWNGRTLPLTVSAGSCPYGIGDREDLVLRRADAAMYANKGKRQPGRRSHR